MREMRKRERERRSNDGKIQTRRESMREFDKHGQCQRERDKDRKNNYRLVS